MQKIYFRITRLRAAFILVSKINLSEISFKAEVVRTTTGFLKY